MLIQLGILVKGEKSIEIEFHKLPRQVNYELFFFKSQKYFGNHNLSVLRKSLRELAFLLKSQQRRQDDQQTSNDSYIRLKNTINRRLNSSH